jgi:transglutaminase-like putative cysteine protease
MVRYRVVHSTEFTYDAVVSDSYNEVRLRPMQDDQQSCLSFRLTTDPESTPASHIDYFGNFVHRFNVPGEHRRLVIEADALVLVQPAPEYPQDGARLSDLASHEGEFDQFYDYLLSTGYVPLDESIIGLRSSIQAASGDSCAAIAHAAMDAVHRTFRYEKGATHVHSSLADTLRSGAGVCQDFAHILLAILRSEGLPARYVSGYLVPKPVDDGGTAIEQIAGGYASHAWVEVYLPGAGWRGLDPTNGSPVGMQHVRVAYGRDYGDVAPVRGVYRGAAGQQLSVDVLVRPAVDGEGHEHLREVTIKRSELPPDQQPQQQ